MLTMADGVDSSSSGCIQSYSSDRNMAGAEGFEPSNAEIKTPCLAAWRRPKKTFVCSGSKAAAPYALLKPDLLG